MRVEKLRIFISLVQRELETERVAVAGWVSADPQLFELCEVVSATLAAAVWQKKGGMINLRHTYGSYLFINSYNQLTDEAKVLRLRFVNGIRIIRGSLVIL
ncbi:MAG: hypothetical protein U9N63_09115 [Pseudomonadota bacterium]|nr:hypothetical protein [Pseudomonadota bacterium]